MRINELRGKVARNLNRQGAKKAAQSLLKLVREPLMDACAAGRLKRLYSGAPVSEGPVRVAFLLQYPEVWDKLEDIYDEMWHREEFEPVLICIPDPDVSGWDGMKIGDMRRAAESLCELKYPERDAIAAVKEDGAVVDLGRYDFEYVFYQRPYDDKLPRSLRSDVVSRYARVCYVPYAFALASFFELMFIRNRSFLRNAYFVFCESESERERIFAIWGKGLGSSYRRFMALGYPVLKRFVQTALDADPGMPNNTLHVLWTPRWSYSSEVGGSHFLEYRDGFSALADSQYELMYRPHPLLWGELVRMGALSEEEIVDYRNSLAARGVRDGLRGSCSENFGWSDVAIMDFSSINIEYFLTGKPLIFCPPDYELTELMDTLVKGMYVANNWEEVLGYLKMLQGGEDPKLEERIEIARSLRTLSEDADIRICDEIFQDCARRKG